MADPAPAGRLYSKAALWGAVGGAVLICVPALVLRVFEGEMAFLELAMYVAAVAAPFVCIVAYRLRPANNAQRLLVPLIIALAAALLSSLALWIDELGMYGIGGRDLALLFGVLGGEMVVLGVPLSFIITWYPRRRAPSSRQGESGMSVRQ